MRKKMQGLSDWPRKKLTRLPNARKRKSVDLKRSERRCVSVPSRKPPRPRSVQIVRLRNVVRTRNRQRRKRKRRRRLRKKLGERK